MVDQLSNQIIGVKKHNREDTYLKAYERFSIETRLASSRTKQPHPFIPSVSKPLLALMLIQEVIRSNLNLIFKPKHWKVILSRPCIYGVFSGRLGGFKPQKNKCTGCLRCVLEHPSFCSVERNPDFTSSADSYWTQKDPTRLSASPVATINYEAETGKIPIKGMGYKGDFAASGWDSMWTDMSEIVRPTRDGVHGREYISTSVNIGRKSPYLQFQKSQLLAKTNTVQIPIPIIFDYLPPALNSKNIQASIKATTQKVGNLYIEKGSEFKNEVNTRDPSQIPLVTSSEVENLSPIVSNASMIEYEYNGSDIIDKIRNINSFAPIIARIPIKRRIEDIAVKLTQEGVDGLHLYANYHGQEFGERKPRFMIELIKKVHSKLIEEGIRDEITIIVSGGIILAEHVPKAIICGADLVAIDTAILIALQCKFEGECLSAETGEVKRELFSNEWGFQRLTNLLGSWHDQLVEILSAMGMRDVRRLRGDIGRAMFNEELEKEAFGDIERST